MTLKPSMLIEQFSDGLRIVTFDPQYRDDFRRLNVTWLTRYFRVEPIDELVLGHPESEILARGGEVLFACLRECVVGTVALKTEEAGIFEVTKMAVDESWQGRGYGRRLLHAACELAKKNAARKVLLYSQRSLAPAIRLYQSYGFKEVPLTDQRYSRCDIKMELPF
jgi:ribosomal protein S18 acetylase RimI-like enzyme